MVTEVIEAPVTEPVTTDPEPVEIQTQEPAPAEPAAEPDDAAAVTQVEVTTPERPDYMTRADWEREKAEVASRAAADALESDRRRRQTENARKAKAEAEQHASDQEAVDTLKAALGAKGIYEVPDDAALAAINRIASKKAERMANASLDVVDEAWDYLTAPAYGKSVDLADHFEEAAKRLGPKVQHLVATIRPAIEAKAREGYIAESELPKRFEAMQAAKNAKGREGQEELRRVEGAPASAERGSREWWSSIGPEGRAKQENQQAFDSWIARQR
jgi:hypothetical protein